MQMFDLNIRPHFSDTYLGRNVPCNQWDMTYLMNEKLQSNIQVCAKGLVTSYDAALECLSKNLNFKSISINCKRCFLGFSVCLVKTCSGACFTGSSDYSRCEECTKSSKCSLAQCTSPNYVPPKDEPAGK